jgi:hypothetical protein
MSGGEHRLGSTTTVEGLALPGRAGAVLQADDGTWYYVGGLDSWDDALVMQRVSVTGVLRLRAADVPAEQPEGEHSTGLADDTLVLDEPSWSLSRG